MNAWTFRDIPKGHKAPPDLTANGEYEHGRPAPICRAKYPDYPYVCTRLPHHTRRHAAGDGHSIVAVWP